MSRRNVAAFGVGSVIGLVLVATRMLFVPYVMARR